MKKSDKLRKKHIAALILCLAITCLPGCGEKGGERPAEAEKAGEQLAGEQPAGTQDAAGLAGETATDAEIDFGTLKKENPDIFAWLHIPGTGIDCPVLQSGEADDFYEEHDAYGNEDPAGAVYIELANLTSMCDFNTVLHGKTGSGQPGSFGELYRFADPDFFEEHETIYLYLEGNVLTYEIFAAYEREDTSLLRSYDFTYLEGCRQFLDDLYGTRDMNINLREGWESVSPYHFLITLTTRKEVDGGRQFIVAAVLTGDAAGTIDRIVAE